MTILAFLIGLAFMGWAVYPMLQKDTTWVSLHLESDDLNDRKQQVYGNIADLDFDYAMGRLSESDFRNIRQTFLAEAGRVLEQYEKRKTSAIVEQIQQDAEHLVASGTSHKHGNSPNSSAQVRCPQCGRENPAEARFCMDCGGSLHD